MDALLLHVLWAGVVLFKSKFAFAAAVCSFLFTAFGTAFLACVGVFVHRAPVWHRRASHADQPGQACIADLLVAVLA